MGPELPDQSLWHLVESTYAQYAWTYCEAMINLNDILIACEHNRVPNCLQCLHQQATGD